MLDNWVHKGVVDKLLRLYWRARTGLVPPAAFLDQGIKVISFYLIQDLHVTQNCSFDIGVQVLCFRLKALIKKPFGDFCWAFAFWISGDLSLERQQTLLLWYDDTEITSSELICICVVLHNRGGVLVIPTVHGFLIALNSSRKCSFNMGWKCFSSSLNHDYYYSFEGWLTLPFFDLKDPRAEHKRVMVTRYIGIGEEWWMEMKLGSYERV